LHNEDILDTILSMDKYLLNQLTPTEIIKNIVGNIRKRRKELKLSQQDLAVKSGVSLGSIKRFENKLEISFSSLINIAIALDCEDSFLTLFSKKKYNSIEDVLNEQT
jgi:transcriptional regulator with XRE-family HTH domain